MTIAITDFSSKTALLIEDNEMNIKLFSLLLRRTKISFDIATDGEMAVEMFKKNHYDIILTDIHIPKLRGYEVAGIIRKDEDASKAKTPIIALTASSLLSETESYLAAGINQVLQKPFTEQDLRTAMQYFFDSI